MNPEPIPTQPGSRQGFLGFLHSRCKGLLGTGLMLLTAAPFLTPVIALFVQRPSIFMDGDQGVDEMAEMRAEHFAQLIGNYSRSPGVSAAQAWSHPGPAWFYAMDPVYALSGSSSWGFAAAAILLHAIFAVLIVGVAWRRGGLWLAAIASALVLLYVQVIGPSIFLAVWPPWATLLPFALLLMLAALGASGSTPALIGALVVGSYLMQLHVATIPVTLVTLVVATALWLLPWLLRRVRRDAAASSGLLAPEHNGQPLSRSQVALCGAGLFAFVAMWVPPLVDEVTSHPGNLTQLFLYFTQAQSSHPVKAAISALAHELEVFPLGHLPTLAVGDTTPVPLLRWIALIGFVLVALALALLGARLRDRFAMAVGVLTLLTVPVIIESLTRADGPLYPYFMDWSTTLPLVLTVGWAELAVTSLPRLARRPEWADARRALPALAAIIAVAALSLSALNSFDAATGLRSATEMSYNPSTPEAWQLTEAAVAGYPPQGIDIDIAQTPEWTLSAGLMDQLVKRGWRVAVPRDWLFMFGNGAAESGAERLELIITDPALPLPSVPGERLIGEFPAGPLTPAADVYIATITPSVPAA